jgi:hypothetical protein
MELKWSPLKWNPKIIKMTEKSFHQQESKIQVEVFMQKFFIAKQLVFIITMNFFLTKVMKCWKLKCYGGLSSN